MKELVKENFWQIFLPDLLLLGIALPLGLVWIYGTWKNWKFFMNPSEDFWFMWFWHWLRKSYGEGPLKFLNYFMGLSITVNVVVELMNSLPPKLNLYIKYIFQ